jgi:hypothetical protein
MHEVWHGYSVNEIIKCESVTEIAAWRRPLDEVKRQVQDTAAKASEGASGVSAPARVNQIAIEQTKTRAPWS